MPDTANVEQILTALGTRLEADATLDGYVGNRIYHAVAPQNDTLPLIVYQLVEVPLSEYMSGNLRIEATIDIDIYATSQVGSAAGVGQIEDRVHVVVHEHAGTGANFDRILFLVQSRGARILQEDSLRATMRVLAVASTSGV